jgi:hypothetical protein
LSAYPTPDAFINDVRKLHYVQSRKDGRPIIQEQLLKAMCRLLARSYEDHFSSTSSHPDGSYKHYLAAVVVALCAYRDHLPGWLSNPVTPSYFSESKLLDLRAAHQAFGESIKGHIAWFKRAGFDRNMYPAYYLPFAEEMPRFDEPEPWFQEREPRFYENEPSDPEDKVDWRNSRRHFQEGELANWKEDKREFEATEIPAWRQRKRDFENYEVARWKERKSQYEKLQKEREYSADELAFIGTPFYDMRLRLKPELQCHIPFTIEDKWRFGSQFIVGASRTGKTTFLTSQIMDDIEKVIRGNASVIVMDSQNEDLIPHLVRLGMFGKGGALEGKLIYLEPAKTPIAANIFDFGNVTSINDEDKEELFRASFENIEFFLNSVFAAEISSPQITMLKYLTQAMPHIPGGNIFTLQQLTTEQGLADNFKHFDRLDPVVVNWLKTKLLGKDFSATRTAVSNRLDTLVADTIFRRMFGAADNALDLFLELQKPKVILINTAGLGGNLEPFGRYFIAKLDEAMLKRKFSAKSAKLPVYFYVDEASEYYANEPRVGKVIDRLGKQMLATIFAVQGTDQFSAAVLAVLQRAAIQAWTLEPPIVNISVNRKEAQAVNVSRIELDKLPRISDEAFTELRQTMATRYGAIRRPPAPKEELSSPEPAPIQETMAAKPTPASPPPADDLSPNVKPDAPSW